MSSSKLEKIAKLEAEMEQIKQRKARLLQEHNAQERKARNHRLCKRSGIIEKLLPGLAGLTDEEFDSFVKRTLTTGYAEKILREIESARPQGNPSLAGDDAPAQEDETAEHIQPDALAQPATQPVPKSAQTAAAPQRAGGSHSAPSGKRQS